jgi:non-specific serine/threonine protein kinase
VLRLGGAIWHFWWTRGYWSEGSRWLDSALAAGTGSGPKLRGDALIGAGMLALWQGDVERGSAVAEELLALAAEADSGRAGALLFAGLVASRRDDEDHAAELYEESARLAREQGDSRLLGMALNNLGGGAVGRGDYERALKLFEESLAIGRELQDQDRLARTFGNLGFTTLMLGDVQRARSLLRDSLIAAREIGLVEGLIGGFVGLGAAYAREDPARAARLLGRADMLCEETGSGLEPLEGRVRDETEAELRARLGEDAYAAPYAEGPGLAVEDALALALGPD